MGAEGCRSTAPGGVTAGLCPSTTGPAVSDCLPDYDFYRNVYHGGAIPTEEWPQYRARALDQLTRYQRVYTVTAPGPDSEPMALCALAEALYTFDLLLSGEGGPVQSASIGSVSVSYGGGAQSLDLSPKGQARELYRRACLYLDICRGVGGCPA